MANELELVVDKISIIEAINRLFIYTDKRDWPRVKECFSSRVLFDMSSMGGGEPTERSPDEIVASWNDGLKSLQQLHHQVGNHLVTISGLKAEAFCYGIASHYLPNKTNNNTRTFIGSYDFSLQKEGQDWRIIMFRFNLKYIDGNLNLETS